MRRNWAMRRGAQQLAGDLAGDLAVTRSELHRVAAHILGRRRFEVSGRFGLRSSPGGLATPAFGEGPEVLRVAGVTLVRERAGSSAYARIDGSTLRQLAHFVGVDLDADFDFGGDGPGLGDIDAPLRLNPQVVAVLSGWYELGWRVLDAVLATLPPDAQPATIQLWPEHFDAGTSVASGPESRVNLGVSPGDGYEAEPYAYVGPQGSGRPGDPGFWNAPFGAVLRYSEARRAQDPAQACKEFFETGLRYTSTAGPSKVHPPG